MAELTQINATARRPVAIHQGTLVDLLAIKKAVDEAIKLSVRATTQQSIAGRGTISRERQQKMNVLAVSRLVHAYALNEVAASVSTMQSASALEETAAKVLKKDPSNLDALYVHFFHERIPSRQLAESTTLDVLNLLIRSRPFDAHLLRSRATVLCFKDDLAAALKDVTAAIMVLHHYKVQNKAESLESQLLFMRGEINLALAIKEIPVSNSADTGDGDRKVRQYAKRATKDFLKFCALFEYTSDFRAGDSAVRALSSLFDSSSQVPSSPETEPETTLATNEKAKPSREEIIRQVAALKAKRLIETAQGGSTSASEVISLLSSARGHSIQDMDGVGTAVTLAGYDHGPQRAAAVTYHPLLPDALHALLLAFTLANPDRVELRRHAKQVLHVLGIMDGYPLFLNPRSSARSDWCEVLRRRGHLILETTEWHIRSGSPLSDTGLENHPNSEYPVSERVGAIVNWIDHSARVSAGATRKGIVGAESVQTGLDSLCISSAPLA